MRGLQGMKWLAIAAVVAIGPAAASEFASTNSGGDCPQSRAAAVDASFTNWPGEGSFFDLAPRSPILVP